MVGCRAGLCLVALSAAACGARTGALDHDEATPSVAPTTSDAALTSDAERGPLADPSGVDASTSLDTDAAAPQCGCTTLPGYSPCPLPLACCPCIDDGLGWSVDRCRDPSKFQCTCHRVLSCS